MQQLPFEVIFAFSKVHELYYLAMYEPVDLSYPFTQLAMISNGNFYQNLQLSNKNCRESPSSALSIVLRERIF